MGNKYLEKCASMFGSTIGAVGTFGKNVAKEVGNQFHLATGGGIRNYAQKEFGINDAKKLIQFTESTSGRKQILTKLKAEGIKNPSQHLRNQTNSARLSSGLIIGGTGYGAYNLARSIPPTQSNQDSYPQYY